MAALVCALAGFVVFQLYGNANHGYIDTASLFYWWGFQWFNAASETQHGFLILGISIFLFFRNLRGDGREAGDGSLEEAAPPAFRVAAAAMVGGLALHAVGFAVQQARISILALLLFAWGVLCIAGGRRWGRAAAFPLAFLVFAIPLNVLDSLGFWLRLGVIDATANLAQAAGIGVVQNGTQLLAPDGRYQYDVAAACSGVRSLMALSALSLLTGYLSFRSWWRRGLLLAVCFPLVYLGNLARIASIVFAAHWGGQQWGERVHDIMGYGIFVIVLGGVFGAGRLLERFLPEKAGGISPESRVQGREPGELSRAAASSVGLRPFDPGLSTLGRSTPSERVARAPAFIALAIIALAAVELALLATLHAMPPRGRAGVQLAADGVNPVGLPPFLGTEWIGRTIDVTAVERDILPPDTGFSRRLYVSISNPTQPVFLSVVLSGRDRTSIHRPELCLVGQGWTVEGSTRHTFRYPGIPGANFEATVLRVRREVRTLRGREIVPEIVAYWFVGGDAVAATPWSRTAIDAWNRLRHLRTDRWAYVLLQTDARAGEEAALARMQVVLDQTLPAFQAPMGR